MTTLQFYAAQATDCRKAADDATLENVRQLKLNAASAWDAMAIRVIRSNKHREDNDEAKRGAIVQATSPVIVEVE